jgi:hypothetical protein
MELLKTNIRNLLLVLDFHMINLICLAGIQRLHLDVMHSTIILAELFLDQMILHTPITIFLFSTFYLQNIRLSKT